MSGAAQRILPVADAGPRRERSQPVLESGQRERSGPGGATIAGHRAEVRRRYAAEGPAGGPGRIPGRRARTRAGPATPDLRAGPDAGAAERAAAESAISRGEDPLLEPARIVTMDRIEVPAADDLPPCANWRQGARRAAGPRSWRESPTDNSAITSVGTANNLLSGGSSTAASPMRVTPGPPLGPPSARSSATISPKYVGGYFSVPLQQPVGAKRLRDRPVTIAAIRPRLPAQPQSDRDRHLQSGGRAQTGARRIKPPSRPRASGAAPSSRTGQVQLRILHHR